MEIIPKTNANINERIVPIILTDISPCPKTTFPTSRTVDIIIIGILIKKENIVHCSLSPPAKSPAEMVVPDLEIPGNIAKP